MELTNEFDVAVSVDEAWAVLTDVEKIAPCLPGAELKEIEGDKYRGVVKVKVGPITASYQGMAHFEELDEVAHRAVLRAEGRETRGQGNASATITATLSPSDRGTKVHVATDLAITGKVAQFARGTLAEVSGKLLEQFVDNLETMVLSPKTEADGSKAPEPKAKAELGAEPKAKPKTEPDAKTAPEPAPESKVKTGHDAKAEPTVEPEPEPEAKTEPKTEPEPDAKADPAAKTEPKAKTQPDTKAKTEPDTKASTGAAVAGRAEPQAETAVQPEAATPPVRHIQSVPAEPVDLVGVAGPSIVRRVLPFATIAGALFLVRIVVYALRRRKS